MGWSRLDVRDESLGLRSGGPIAIVFSLVVIGIAASIAPAFNSARIRIVDGLRAVT